MDSMFGPRVQMVALFLGGIGLAVGNHFYYRYLSGKPEGSRSFYGHNISQTVSGAIGNAFAVIVRSSFAAVIGIALIQRFWRILGIKQRRVSEVDTIFAASQGQLPSSLCSWFIAPRLAVIASAAMLMALVSVIAPGALTVSLEGFHQACNVSTSKIENANLASYYVYTNDESTTHLHNPQIPALSVANRVITTGSYLPPPSPCGVCSYEVSFVGASMECSNVTEGFNFTSVLLDPTDPANDQWMGLWAASFSYDTDLSVLVATQDGNTSAVRKSAVKCTAYGANYTVLVDHGNSISTVTVQNLTIGEQLNATMVPPVDPVLQQLNGLAAAVGTLLDGNVTYRPNYCEYFSATSPIAYSPILQQTDDCRGSGEYSNFQWPDMLEALPSIMKNASISLLSGAYAGSAGQDYLIPFDTTCTVTTLSYSYNPLRLLVTYGAAAIVTAICIFFGFRTVAANGKEETLKFSRLMHALSNDDLTQAIGALDDLKDEKVRADNNGVIRPVV
ncbi:hypothetical protein B0H10DRAFT_2325807 [Mycena sp. CBHHK59/15]|nr:hypothetical protein B0H10DRAFT_2325807 [Mycena sp. CBHHK59/15]